tara:strand:+ start:14542 stop:14979 length:438 start_codon:yes stop_codon:yes gene_type:complete
MVTVKHKFSQELYNRFDNPAKVALLKLLEAQGHVLSRVEENYYADVETVKDGITYYSEAEVKRAWQDIWPDSWKEIRIPARKQRLLKKYNSNVNFYVFNAPLEQCWLIRGKQMLASTIREAKGRLISKGEEFFHIPYKEAELIRI